MDFAGAAVENALSDNAPSAPLRQPESLVKLEPALFVGVDPQDSDAPPPLAPSRKPHLEDAINSMIPPREWTEETGTWMQYASKKSATRQDVINLQEELDRRLVARQAREGGLCPVREDLYEQAFEELIRQVAIDNPERGLILLRVRDEMKMCIDAYKALYESSQRFGVKKLLQAENGIDDLESEIAVLQEENKDLDQQTSQLRTKLDVMEKRNAELRILEEKKHKEERDYLKSQGSHLDAFIKQMGG